MIRSFSLILLVIIAISCKEKRSSQQESPTVEIRPTEKSNDTINNLLNVENPVPGQLIKSPLEITGEARGYWFFEATAPVMLLDGNMDQISEFYITAIGEWMTEDWVAFKKTINFESQPTNNGFLILHKANASGLKENEMSDTIPVRFRR